MKKEKSEEIKQIEKAIKKDYGTKYNFVQKQGYVYQDFANKLRTWQSKFEWLNNFLAPLGMSVELKDSENESE
jgi:hypothetical protein